MNYFIWTSNKFIVISNDFMTFFCGSEQNSLQYSAGTRLSYYHVSGLFTDLSVKSMIILIILDYVIHESCPRIAQVTIVVCCLEQALMYISYLFWVFPLGLEREHDRFHTVYTCIWSGVTLKLFMLSLIQFTV